MQGGRAQDPLGELVEISLGYRDGEDVGLQRHAVQQRTQLTFDHIGRAARLPQVPLEGPHRGGPHLVVDLADPVLLVVADLQVEPQLPAQHREQPLQGVQAGRLGAALDG